MVMDSRVLLCATHSQGGGPRMHVQTQVPAIGLEPLEEACRLHDLAVSFRAQGQYAEALASSQQALAVFEREVGPDHPDVANVLNNLAGIHQDQGEYTEAERLYRRSGEILDTLPASLEVDML